MTQSIRAVTAILIVSLFPGVMSAAEPPLEAISKTWTGLDKSGRPNIYPCLPDRYRTAMKRVDFSEYRLMKQVPA